MGKIGTVTGGTSGLGGVLIGTVQPNPTVSLGPGAVVASPAPPAAPAAPPPAPPAYVAPMPTADDLLAVNQWLTDWQSQLEDIDYGISQQELDTAYTKGQNARQATEDRTAADEAMAARGIFGSSLQAAAAYDIEATRALANTYLDNRLQEAITAGATRKGTLATAKTKFEQGMAAKYGENAKAVNDELNAGYAEALANYKPPKATAPSSLGASAPKAKPAVPKAISGRPQPQSGKKKLVGTVSPNVASGLGTLAGKKNPKPKKPDNKRR